MKINRAKACIIPIIICFILSALSSGYALNAISEAEVEFTPGMGPTYPVHPEDPNTDGNDGAVEGSLAIVSISHFDFGTMQISAATQMLDNVTTMPNLQVVDLRGTASGWKVSASVSRFNDGLNDTLPGASIHITSGRPNSLSSSLAPEQIQDTRLTADEEPVPVVKAQAGAGTGLWVMRWYPSEAGTQYVKLEIPAGAATAGSHSATINWILLDTP